MNNVETQGDSSLIANAQTSPVMKVAAPTIVAAELWIESADKSTLELSERLVIAGTQVEEVLARSGSVGKTPAERAWQDKELVAISSSDTESNEVCPLVEGVDSIIAYPCSCNDSFHGVLVLCLQFGVEGRGAVEVWGRDDREELGLVFSHYANLQLISRISHYVKFPRAAGLPGQTWDTRAPIIMEKLDRQINFMRSTAAKSDGLSTGLSIPLMKTEFDLKEVLVLLSSTLSPIARCFEVWKLNTENNKLVWESAAYGPYIELESASKKLQLAPGDDLAGQVLVDGTPKLFDTLPPLVSQRSALVEQYGFRQAITWPVYVGQEIGAIVNLYF